MSQPSNFAFGFTGGVIGCMTYQYALLKELEDEAVGLRKDFIALRRKLELAVPLLVRDDDFLKKTHRRNFGLRKPPTMMDKIQDRMKHAWNRGLIEFVRMCNDVGK
ncbi:hypothetical protein K493DRAFT_320296 [Basidiobolus meristosporus CBS 931.73]|uniref:Uncharacterized protein n=1 Tax=Basidiobolus meristosporus CBS 931.73 TaxID=1314790 RepID=A0A1Y1XBS7_9FUNG|nr:hypothetical protein K493DRAFT_320296 [Basidiobolus meristosporus CBS 931.73]|eukprot:ORX83198.1 hypothetical protein K493DRAFT_320296 [Basidiobolus meristosporus CBS 931.73]